MEALPYSYVISVLSVNASFILPCRQSLAYAAHAFNIANTKLHQATKVPGIQNYMFEHSV